MTRKEGSKGTYSLPCCLDAHLRKCSGERLGRQWLGVKGSDNGQLMHDDDDDVHVPGQSRGKRAAACVQPLLHQQLSCACTVTNEHESVFAYSTRACCPRLSESFLISVLDIFKCIFSSICQVIAM